MQAAGKSTRWWFVISLCEAYPQSAALLKDFPFVHQKHQANTIEQR